MTEEDLRAENRTLRAQIAQQERTIRRLRGREEGYYKLIELLPDAITIIDAAGRLRYTNAAGARLLGGADADTFDGKDFWQFIPADEQDAMQERMRRLRRGEKVEFIEHRIRRLDGEETPVETASVPVMHEGRPAVMSAARDLSARKRLEIAKRESQALSQQIFEVSPTPITITRLDDGRFLDVNDAFCRAIGYERNQIINRTVVELGLWAQAEQRAELVDLLRAEGRLQDFEMEFHTRTGEAREWLLSCQLMTIEGEQCILAVQRDITTRKRTEQALRRAKARAEEAARFRQGILTNMTHEVRTPLTVILGFTSTLREGVPEGYARFVDIIERSGRRLLLTLNSLLDLAQLEADTLEVEARPHDVVEVARGAVDALDALARKKGLSVEVHTDAPRAYARVDHQLLGRALHHLVHNAIKFTDEGRVTVEVRRDAGCVYVAVRDTGVGIAADFIPRLFEPFAQESSGLERTYQGSGLGLTVAGQLVEALGGTLEVESRKGEGSTFTVVLPEAEMAAAA